MGLLEGAISSLSCLSPVKAATLNLKLGFSTASCTANFKLKKPCLRIQRRRITYPSTGYVTCGFIYTWYLSRNYAVSRGRADCRHPRWPKMPAREVGSPSEPRCDLVCHKGRNVFEIRGHRTRVRANRHRRKERGLGGSGGGPVVGCGPRHP